jgi:alkylation response protein AidB-like acyl-CoA dehydrogenase
MPGVVLGIARSALDTFAELAERKQITTSMLTGRKVMLRDEAYAQSAAAHAESVVGSARSYIFERMASMWETLRAGNTPSVKQRALFRAALVHAHSACVQAVELLYKAYGGSAVYASGPFDRHLRDVLTINQHTVNSPKVLETAGRVLLGLDLHDPLF